MEVEMECVCGEILKAEAAEKGQPSQLEKQFREHLARKDHQISPAQWKVASDRIEAAREAKKKTALGAEKG